MNLLTLPERTMYLHIRHSDAIMKSWKHNGDTVISQVKFQLTEAKTIINKYTAIIFIRKKNKIYIKKSKTKQNKTKNKQGQANRLFKSEKHRQYGKYVTIKSRYMLYIFQTSQ